jgi:hypothetical protein
MGGEHASVELRRQLEVVQRRLDQAVGRLARTRGHLALSASVAIDTRAVPWGDLHLLCVRLEVALAESAEAAERLAAGLRQPPQSAAAGPLSQPGSRR